MNRFIAAAIMAAAAGCTMCPDPYDYSGPVPNGSAPQNDFRARSHGIIPIGALPAPWPSIVERKADESSDQGVVSAGARPVPALVAAAIAADTATDMGPEDDASTAVARTSAEKAEATNANESAAELVVTPEVELAPVDAGSAVPETAASQGEAANPAEILPPSPQPDSTVPVGPVPRETPGWRPRPQH